MVRCAELIEAEGRALRAHSINVGIALAFILTASLVGVLAVGFLAAALYLSLRDAGLDPAPAALICGAICAALAGVLVWIARRLVR